MPEAVELPGRPVRKGDKVRILPPRGETPKQADERLWRVVDDRPRRTGTGRRRWWRSTTPSDDATARRRRPRRRRRVPRPDLPGPRLDRQGRARRRQAVPHGHQRRELPRPPDAALHAPRQGRLHLHRPAVQHRREGLEVQQRLRRGRRPLPPLQVARVHGAAAAAREGAAQPRRLGPHRHDRREGVPAARPAAGADLSRRATSRWSASVINPKGVARAGSFARVDEYVFFVMLGERQSPARSSATCSTRSRSTQRGRRSLAGICSGVGTTGARAVDRPEPVLPGLRRRADGSRIRLGWRAARRWTSTDDVVAARRDALRSGRFGTDGTEGRWRIGAGRRSRLSRPTGYVRARATCKPRRLRPIYVPHSRRRQRRSRRASSRSSGSDADGSVDRRRDAIRAARRCPTTVMERCQSHDAGEYGARAASSAPSRPASFPFPKSLYAVEDALRFFVADKPDAVVLDFFAGSGTTAHAVMRLNKQDGGRRRSISVTNNEVSADEQKALRETGLRPGDPEWEALGICELHHEAADRGRGHRHDARRRADQG